MGLGPHLADVHAFACILVHVLVVMSNVHVLLYTVLRTVYRLLSQSLVLALVLSDRLK